MMEILIEHHLDWKERAQAMEAALRTIHDTFAKDLAQGARTRDKEFAVSIASFALKNSGAAQESGESRATNSGDRLVGDDD